MANLMLRAGGWHQAGRVTPEGVFWRRREFLRGLGFAGIGLWACRAGGNAGAGEAPSSAPGYPYRRNPSYDLPGKLTDEKAASVYNNFYEFSLRKDVHRHVGKFETTPWEIEVTGLVERPLRLDASQWIAEMPLEERVYRFRCVEAWAMVVPWTGFPFAKLAERVKPTSGAKFVRFVSAAKPEQMPGIAANPEYPWPYFEGLRLDEAMHPLTLIATGVYGKPLPKQFGAPIRLIVPWKYGYKSPKSLVRIEFVAEQPKTFWESLLPNEYPFESNVNPDVPHPRWSQATERMIDTGDRVKTRKFNGYGDQVSKLYPA